MSAHSRSRGDRSALPRSSGDAPASPPGPLRRRTPAAALLVLLLVAAKPAAPPGESAAATDPRSKVLDSLHRELLRSKRLAAEGFDPPYFVSYLLRDVTRMNVTGKYGAVYESSMTRARNLFADVRVGSYDLDSSGEGGFEFNYDPDADYGSLYNYVRAPVDDDPDALRDALWLLTDYKYKEALQSYLRKKGKTVYSVARKEPLADFSREEAVKFRGPPAKTSLDEERWKAIVREEGAYLKRYPEIFDSGITATAQLSTKYFVSNEGHSIVYDETLFAFSATALTRADDGQLLEGGRVLYARSPEAFADRAAIHREVEAMAADLLALRTAEVLPPYSGPAVLAPKVTGVFFHEAIGHRLEGKRQRSDKEGQTFKDKLGQPILPSFLTVVDDPSLPRFGTVDLNGHYPFDDEGVPARPVTLVERGVLRNFLLGRSPIEGFAKSNGHGRNASFEDPMGRMANLVVRGAKPVSRAELERRLIAEARRQGKPFGIWIEEVGGGETSTQRGDVQAFHGIPTRMFKVDARTGRRTLVRGAEFIGTPLTAVSKILATGDEVDVFNGFCGAESGYIPVSTVAPAVLLQELELQRSSSQKRKPPILPPPAFD